MTISASVQSVLLTRIVPNPDQPRKAFDPVKIEELAQSIKSNGLLQPITVVQAFKVGYQVIPIDNDSDKELWSLYSKHGDKPFVIPTRLANSAANLISRVSDRGLDVDYFHNISAVLMIVAGERRWRASIHANMDKIDCVVKRIASSEIFRLAMIENALRSDMTPMETAAALQQLVNEEFDKINSLPTDEERTEAEIVKQAVYNVSGFTGIKKGTIIDTIRLLNLLPDVQLALNNGEITTNHAWQLARMTTDDKQLKLFRLIMAGKCNTSSKLYQSAKAINAEIYLSQFSQTSLVGNEYNDCPQAAELIKQVEDIAAKMAALSADESVNDALAKLGGDRLDYLVTVLGNLSATTKKIRKDTEYYLGAANVANAA